MRAHVVPVPTGFGLEGEDSPDVLGADRAAARRSPAQITIFDVGARAVAGEALLADSETGQRLCEHPRPLIARREAGAAVAMTIGGVAGSGNRFVQGFGHCGNSGSQ